MEREDLLKIAEAQQRIDLARFEANTQRSLEAARAGNKMASDATRAVTLINGGAAIAMLAFIGHLASSAVQQSVVVSLMPAFAGFVAGTFLAVCVAVLTYFIQEFLTGALRHQFKKLELEQGPRLDAEAIANAARREMRCKGWASIIKSVAISCGLLALLCFVIASTLAYRSFRKMDSARQSAPEYHCHEVY